MVSVSESQINLYKSYVTMIGDPGSKDENKLQAAQEINENLEVYFPIFMCTDLSMRY